jgi:hypothetical protein
MGSEPVRLHIPVQAEVVLLDALGRARSLFEMHIQSYSAVRINIPLFSMLSQPPSMRDISKVTVTLGQAILKCLRLSVPSKGLLVEVRRGEGQRISMHLGRIGRNEC